LALEPGASEVSRFAGIANIPRRFGRFLGNREIAQRIGLVGFVAGYYEELFRQLLVRKAGQSQDLRGIRCGQVTAEMTCHVVKQSFGLLQTEPFDSPHDLMFFGRSVQHKIGRRDFQRIPSLCSGL